MLRLLTIVLLAGILVSAPVQAQGPIAAAVVAQYGIQCPCPDHKEDQDTHHDHHGMRSPLKFWTGLALVGAGSAIAVSAVTWARETSTSEGEQINVTHAPCRTDPVLTRLPIANCRVNHPLLWMGVGLQAAGVLLVISGGQSNPSVGVKVRF